MKHSIFLIFLFFTAVIHAQTVTIGTQVWMDENLESASFQDGTTIAHAQNREAWQQATENGQPAWAWYYDETIGQQYGYMYNIHAVNKGNPCPEGFRIPNIDDWEKLFTFLGEDLAAKKMKSTSGWDDNGNGTNTNAFNALPGGVKSGYGGFNNYKKQASFWANTIHDEHGLWSVVLMWWSDKAIINPSGKKGGLNCRCIKE
ncbi:MAG TPA: fibrobacter succinogenes major paralogous domain-containing protein [Salinimicrobium sp.]|nr:fibrobacter succinogenes major paralogous domain-containing protein [Salinimicrobium sp.]